MDLEESEISGDEGQPMNMHRHDRSVRKCIGALSGRHTIPRGKRTSMRASGPPTRRARPTMLVELEEPEIESDPLGQDMASVVQCHLTPPPTP